MPERNADRRTRGGVLVEFAFASIILAPMLMGTFSFGLAFRNYSDLLVAVRNAARYASMQDYDSWNATPTAAYVTRVRNMVLYGNPDGGSTPVVPGLTPANVNVTIAWFNGRPDTVTVSVTNYPLVSFFRPITLTNKPKITFPYMGRLAPPV